MNKIGFDNDKYLKMQSQNIRDRIARFGGKLYLEFGGKLFDDFHASRVLPGFKPDSKINMLLELKDQAEIVIVISANAIEKNKVRGDLGITYDLETLRLIDSLREIGIYVGSIVITHYNSQPMADLFCKRLKALGIKFYKHYPIQDYPSNIPLIVSDDGYGKNEYIETTRSLIVVTAPGPGSGKMATCLSQLYHDYKRGIKAGYAKFETFPVWNLPLNHPVNLAYEAATADLDDLNMIDPFHLEAYDKTAVNYNRDIEIFPVLNAMFQKIMDESPYKSPTDMGVNMAGYCITDPEVVFAASKQEVIRRYYNARCAVCQGTGEQDEVFKIEMIMNRLEISSDDRPEIKASLELEEKTGAPATALTLPDGTMITGKTSQLLGSSAGLLLNALKHLAGIDHNTLLISPSAIEPIQEIKVKHMGSKNPRLHSDETLIALAMCAATNETAALALSQLSKLRGCEAHSSVILSKVDERIYQKLGINITYEPKYQTQKLYHN